MPIAPVSQHEVALAPQPPTPARVQKPRRREADDRQWTIGIGPLLLGNVHWLDAPKDRSVQVRNSRGKDDLYPGFVGVDGTIGLMLDLRAWHFLGVEIDLFRQNDRGAGKIVVQDSGNLCFLPAARIPYGSERYRVTIGQDAWHLPVLFKLSIPGRRVVVEGDEVEWEYYRWFTTFALGPEFVFPSAAEFSVSPESGLDYPIRASASKYVMYTAALGFERRLADRHDIRLLFSLRGSYYPGAGSTAMERGEYRVVGAQVVPISYTSEWRYQAALTFGVGWFF